MADKKLSGKRLSDDVMNFVFEERGISNEVSSIAEDIFSQITDSIKKKISQEEVTADDTIHFKDGFTYIDYGLRFSVEWDFYNVGNVADMTREMITFASANITKGIMRVSLNAIRFHYDSAYFKETIQHETMHFFENYMRGYVPYKKQDIYNKAYGLLKQTDIRLSDVQKYAAEIIYISTAYEQRAFANGAYRHIMSRCNGNGFDFRRAMMETKLYAWLKETERAVAFFSKYEGDEPEIIHELNEYSMDFSELMATAKGAMKNITRQLGRIVSKSMDDVEKECPMSGAINPEPNEARERRISEEWTRLNKKYFLC